MLRNTTPSSIRKRLVLKNMLLLCTVTEILAPTVFGQRPENLKNPTDLNVRAYANKFRFYKID